ncbi:MAG TPA: hypothetical protein VEB40_01510, partial [Flavipsychrobacter sp.]|nr:hypothetical protein [Flavipsychrobacter sp.]
MTRSLSTLLLLLACFNCEAQKISFTDTSNMWALYSFDIGTLQNDTITYQKYFGETIINGITYFNLENWDVRPDSTGDIIFARTGTGTEFILYDFSLNLGDTIHTSVWGTYH